MPSSAPRLVPVAMTKNKLEFIFASRGPYLGSLVSHLTLPTGAVPTAKRGSEQY